MEVLNEGRHDSAEWLELAQLIRFRIKLDDEDLNCKSAHNTSSVRIRAPPGLKEANGGAAVQTHLLQLIEVRSEPRAGVLSSSLCPYLLRVLLLGNRTNRDVESPRVGPEDDHPDDPSQPLSRALAALCGNHATPYESA